MGVGKLSWAAAIVATLTDAMSRSRHSDESHECTLALSQYSFTAIGW